MSRKNPSLLNKMLRNFFWFSYYGIIASHILASTVNFFSPESGIPLFYQILYYYYPIYLLRYLIDFFQIIFSLIQLFPLSLYIFRIHLSNKIFWKATFILHVICSILGNTYAKMQIKSLYHENTTFFTIALIAMVILYLPLFYATYRYAFMNQKN